MEYFWLNENLNMVFMLLFIVIIVLLRLAGSPHLPGLFGRQTMAIPEIIFTGSITVISDMIFPSTIYVLIFTKET
jgi:hypothetical protein